MQPTPTHTFFETVSKAVIIIPIIILVLAILTQVNPPSLLSQKNAPSPSLQPTLVPTDAIVPKISSTPLNLEGPMQCSAQNHQMNVKAYIKHKKIYAEVTKASKLQHFLINGDCLYQWPQGLSAGKETCGMSQYMSIAESMASFKILTAESLVNIIATIPGDTKEKQMIKEDYNGLRPVCHDAPVADNTFAVPGNITFKLAPTSTPFSTSDY